MRRLCVLSVLTVLLVPQAHAQPLAPTSVQSAPFSVELSGMLGANRTYLHQAGCTTGNCFAIRKEALQGGEGTLWFTPNFGVYGGAAHETEVDSAALFTGAGYSVHAGLKGGLALHDGLGIYGWATLTHTEDNQVSTLKGGAAAQAQEASQLASQTGPPDETRRNQVEIGAVARIGQNDGGFDGWVGLEAMPVAADQTRVVDGSIVILNPFIPISGVAGVRIISEPLGSQWSKRGKLTAGVTGSLGYRVGVTGWLTASL